ncbi:BOX PROTEIN putative-RELATED [Salix koriyanagi]|uniref:BOX PROTEIN putative-RELATED n=1 Tax=Salix koriyanagi TaxID=2511006 RepID=A0A9Q1A5G4_9ROSI|nr:BOX PROTEIN putative-RELATED [Salix koriyanagi]
MARRETAEQRSVTLTKRRQGLFNKAAELCRICDARIAIMVSSTGSKEKVDAVFNKFLDDFPASEAAGASHEEEIKSACNSLHEDIKALESEELQDAVKSLESLLGLAKKKLNNPTGNLGISNIIEPKSDGYLALGFKPHYGSSSSLDDKVCQNSAKNVEFISANYSDSWATSDGSPGNNGIDFPGEVDIDYIWDCIPSLDFNSASDRVHSDNSSNGCATSRTAYGSDSRSQENGDNVFPASLDSGYLEAMEFLDYGIKTTPGSDFWDIIKQH